MKISYIESPEENTLLKENTIFIFGVGEYILRQEYYENGYDCEPCFGIGIYKKSTGKMLFHTGNARYAVFSDEQARKYIDDLEFIKD